MRAPEGGPWRYILGRCIAYALAPQDASSCAAALHGKRVTELSHPGASIRVNRSARVPAHRLVERSCVEFRVPSGAMTCTRDVPTCFANGLIVFSSSGQQKKHRVRFTAVR